MDLKSKENDFLLESLITHMMSIQKSKRSVGWGLMVDGAIKME